MKLIITALLFITTITLFAQNDSIEKSILYKKFLAKEISNEELSELGMKWNKTIKKLEGYPEIPVNQLGQVHYTFLDQFENTTQEKLFNHTIEWLAIHYGLIPAYIYSNAPDGKIIFKNSFDVKTNHTCNYTCVITINNQTLMTEFLNIDFQIFYAGHYYDDTWVPDKTINYEFNQIFPIILKKSGEWESQISFLKTMDNYLNNEVTSLSDYIVSYDTIYKF